MTDRSTESWQHAALRRRRPRNPAIRIPRSMRISNFHIQFLFTITFFHEPDNVFKAFLSLSEQPTPNELTPNLSGIHERTEADAGNSLEGSMLRDPVVHGRHDDYDDSHLSLYMHFSLEDFNGKLTHDLVRRRASPSQRD